MNEKLSLDDNRWTNDGEWWTRMKNITFTVGTRTLRPKNGKGSQIEIELTELAYVYDSEERERCLIIIDIVKRSTNIMCDGTCIS